jgi:acyl-CoA thioester hydrolase
MKFSHNFLVQPGDIDEQGHVNNVAYVKWVQDVAVAHWFHIATDEQKAKYVWVILRHEIDYKKQGFEGEEITATTWVGKPTAVTWERFTEIHRGQDLLVKSKTIWCLLDRETAKPSRITMEMKESFN